MEDIGYLTIAVLTSIGLFYAFDALTEAYIKFKTRKEVKRLKEKKETKGMKYNFNDKKYMMVVTSEYERYNNGKEDSKWLDFFSNNPWEGNFECVCTGNDADELMDADLEGLFYQLYETEDGKRIGAGILSYDALKNDIEEYKLVNIMPVNNKERYSMDNLEFLEIYCNAINTAIETCKNILEKLGFDVYEIDDMNSAAMNKLGMNGYWGNITNSIIEAYYTVTASMIKKRYPEKEVTWCIDGPDSDFCIDGEVQ